MTARLFQVAILVGASLLSVGCQMAESMFWLAQESRIPAWFSIPAGANRGDLQVKFTFFGGYANVSADHRGSQWAQEVRARTERGISPVKSEDIQLASRFKTFEVMSVGEVQEVLGFRPLASDPLRLELVVIDEPNLRQAVLLRAAEQESEWQRKRAE